MKSGREHNKGSAVGAVASGRHARLLHRATYASIGTALLLIAIKTVAWTATGSVSLLSSLVDSLLDLAASLVTFVGVRFALQPADAEHRFGHGKAEPLAGLAQSAFVAGSAVFVLVEAVSRLAVPRPVANAEFGIAVILVSTLITGLLVAYQRHVVRATGSVAIGADSLHYRGDLLLNGTVLLSLGLYSWLEVLAIDSLFGAAIAVYILYGAYRIARMAFDLLIDRELPESDRERIRTIALLHHDVRELHDLRTRSAGAQSFIQFHLELDGNMTLARAHVISDEVESALRAAFPQAEVIIHQDPEGADLESSAFGRGE